MRHTLIITLSIILSIMMIACGGPNKALISQFEIDSAQSNGSLPALYQKAQNMVEQSKGSSKKEAIALRSKITTLLVADANQKIDQLITQQLQDVSSVSRQKLLQTQTEISPMQQWSATDYARLNPRLEQAMSVVNNLITEAIKDSELANKDVVAKVLALKRAAGLAGKDQPEAMIYQKENEKAIGQLSYQGNDALSKRLYSTVIAAAEGGLKLDPGNIKFESMLSQGKAGLFEKDFRFALEQGKPESAYQSLIDVADDPIFLQLKKSMNKSILLLANYFAGSAQSAYQKGDLATAYVNFRRGRTIQEKLAVYPKGFIQEKRFLDLLMVKARVQSYGAGKRQAYMRIINEFDTNYPGLKSEYLKLNDELKSRAMTKLSVADFKEVMSADSVVASVGRRIGSKLEKILFERLGNEVLIVTNADQMQAQGFNGLALKIDGEVLQAAIESSSNQGKRSQQVQTGVDRVETEAYTKWARRKRGDKPKQYDETPIIEEVVLTVEHIRKQAVAEVAFRIVEPATGKILLTNNFVKESEFSGESINEYQKGDFHQAYIRADLPSDIKIMDDLASELAVQLGDKLSQYLQSPEQVFHHKYVEAKAQGDQAAATEYLANALIIAESKTKDTSSWYEDLKSLVL